MKYDHDLFVDAAHIQAKRLLSLGISVAHLLKELATNSGEESIVIQAFGTKAIGDENIKAFAKAVRELIRVYAKVNKLDVNLKSMYKNALWKETPLCAVEILKTSLEMERSENAINRLYDEMAKVGTETSFEFFFESVCPRTGDSTRKRLIKTVLLSKAGESTGLLFGLHSSGRSITFSVAGHIGSHYFEVGAASQVKALAYRALELERSIREANVSNLRDLGRIFEQGKSMIAAPVIEQTLELPDDVTFISDINRMQRES